jgi:hypothetical protein
MNDGKLEPTEEEVEKLIEAFSLLAEVADVEALHENPLKQA